MIRNRGKERDGMELDERLRQENTSRTFQWSSRETHSLQQTSSMSCLHVSNTMLPSSDHRGKHAVFSKQVWSDVCLCERPAWILHVQRDLLHRSTVMLSLTRIYDEINIYIFGLFRSDRTKDSGKMNGSGRLGKTQGTYAKHRDVDCRCKTILHTRSK